MADYILIRKTRNAASSAVHVLLNIVFGIGSVMVTALTGNPVMGLILVALSKWRVFAVRPRYIWTNFKANLIDFIVGISVVLLVYFFGLGTNDILIADIILAVFYCAWLILIKPLTSDNAILAQAMIAVFLGSSAATIASASADPIFLVISAFIIGYSAARHILVQENDENNVFSTLASGLIFAEIAWLCHTWMIVYSYSFIGIRIPQIAIILTVFTFIFSAVRRAIFRHEEEFKFSDVAAPIIFGVLIIGVILIWFSNPIFNI
ncbi:hypothetical protein IKP94_00890 [Candidatus Saccharibacteria bacterium]|nr:hypothetical protein [Candidatus Saccharibacteria bacterium]MBR6964878.1 hypothetical protein [Candidatus Saccharibacteria bacterium]